MKPRKSTYAEAATASVRTAEGTKDSVQKQPWIPSVPSAMTANVFLTKTSFLLKLASCRRINLSVVAEEFVSVENVYVTKPSLGVYTADTVRRMTFLVHITMEMCVLAMGNVKVANASALLAGKEIGASVPQP